jgi:hypothetical protein
VEWLWVVLIALIIFGPIVFAVTRNRSRQAPSGDDVNAASTVADTVRYTASHGRAPDGSGGPLPPPS